MNLMQALGVSPAEEMPVLEQEWNHVAALRKAGLTTCARQALAALYGRMYLRLPKGRVEAYNEAHTPTFTCPDCKHIDNCHGVGRNLLAALYGPLECRGDAKCRCKLAKADVIQKAASPEMAWTVLAYVALEDFAGEAPPQPILDRLRNCQRTKAFDRYLILEAQQTTAAETVTRLRDPLLVGFLEGVKDGFILGQWGHDVQADDVT